MKRWIGVVASLLLIGFIYQAKGVTWTIEKVTDNTEDDASSPQTLQVFIWSITTMMEI